MRKKRKRENDLLYLFLVWMLICCGSNTLYTQIFISTQYSAYLVFFTSIVIYFLKNKSTVRLRRHSTSMLFLIIFLFMVTMVNNWDINNFNGYILMMLKIGGAFLYLSALDFDKLKDAFSKVMYVLAIASLIITYVFPFFSLETRLPIVLNSMGIPFYNGILAFKINSYGTYAIRNYGIFSEPAVYCFYLFLAALFTYSTAKFTKESVMKLCVFAITMVTTFSPIGFLTAVAIYLLTICKTSKSSVNKNYLIVLVSVMFWIICFFILNPNWNSGFSYLINKMNLSTGTGSGRVDSIVYNIKKWLENPFFGGGLKSVSEIAGTFGYNTSTTGTMLSGFGIIFTILISCFQLESVTIVLKKSNLFIIGIMYVLFLLQINNHGLIQGDWFWMFTMIGVVVKKNETFSNSR